MSGSSEAAAFSASSADTAWPTTRTRPGNRASSALSPSRTISWSSTRSRRNGVPGMRRQYAKPSTERTASTATSRGSGRVTTAFHQPQDHGGEDELHRELHLPAGYDDAVGARHERVV